MTQDLNEAETRAELIDPALTTAGWGKVDESRIRREVITNGRLIGGGKRSKQDIADYVLVFRGQKLAVIEAKRVGLPDTEGVGQAKRYATKLQARFAYSTNGKGIYRIDMETGEEGYVSAYPTPGELWNATFANSSGNPEIGILNQQTSGHVRVQIRDSVTGNIVTNLWYQDQHTPVFRNGRNIL